MSHSPSSRTPPFATDPSAAEPSENGPDGVAAVTRRGRPSVADARLLSDKILEASWQVLLAHGFENFTFDRVARHAHIGKATIYSRFSGKTDLMQALLVWRMDRQREEILSDSGGMEPVEAFTLRAERVLEVLFSPSGLLVERLIDWVDQEAGVSVGRGEVYRSALQSIADEFRACNEAGLTRITNVDLAARFWLEGLLGHVRLAMSQGDSGSADNAAWAREYVSANSCSWH